MRACRSGSAIYEPELMSMEPEHLLNPVQVKYSDDSSFIYVTINPREVLNQQLSAEEILEALIESGFSSFEYQLDQEIMDELIGLPWTRLNRVIVRRIAYRVEFDLKLTLSPDQMQAFVTVEPAFAEERISRERLLDRLDHAGIHEGLIEDALEQILELGEARALEIAHGQPPVHGEDGWTERLILPLHLLEERCLPPGTPLLRLYPPTEGQDGHTVTGRVLPARKGLVKPIKAGEGCAFSETDPNLIVAAREGIPVYSAFSVRMDELHYLRAEELQDNGLASQDYPHSVEISGSIPAELKLKLSTQGHLIVEGDVAGGCFEAGAEMLITGEVTGPIWLQSAAQMTLHEVSEALIHCAGNLVVLGHLEQCHVYLAGALQGPEAWMAGGLLQAQDEVVLYQVGQPGFVPTTLELRRQDYFAQRQLFLRAERRQVKADLEQALKDLIRMRSGQGQIETILERQNFLRYRDEALAREEELLVPRPHKTELSVLDQLYPGVLLCSESQEFQVEEMRQAQKVSFSATGLGWQSLRAESDMHPESHRE